MTNGLAGVPLTLTPLKRKDFASGAEVRWCPGCGDYSILSTLQGVLAETGIARHNTVVVSGIGCSSRFPYYMASYGMHSIHGRAPAIATGLAMTRPDLAVIVATGDGDALSIGGNHLIHALRRNINLTIVVFNNRIYGLTKGQFSPTSEKGKITKSSPYGSLDAPLNAVSLGLASEATFVARSIDSERSHLAETLDAAIHHRGASLVEVFQNCPIFNDGAWSDLSTPDSDGLVRLVPGEPIISDSGRLGVVAKSDGSLRLAPVEEEDTIVRHDPAGDVARAFALSRLTDTGHMRHAPIGIFRHVEAPTFDDESRARVASDVSAAEIDAMLTGDDTWRVG